MTPAYFPGLPIWHQPDWRGLILPRDARSNDALRHYAQVFPAVEGNCTFYGLPRPSTVQRWISDTPANFRFCCKFPKQISHEAALEHVSQATRECLHRLAPLEERLGMLFLQLPARFSPVALASLSRFLDTLPKDFHYAVEVRHSDFFNKGEAERRLHGILRERGMDRVVLDSRALFATPVDDAAGYEARQRKPRLPVHAAALGKHPLIRFIGHPQLAANDAFLRPWLSTLQRWIGEQRQPFFFLHTPSNREAPWLAQRFHEQLCHYISLPPLADWPGAQPSPTQLGLFEAPPS